MVKGTAASLYLALSVVGNLVVSVTGVPFRFKRVLAGLQYIPVVVMLFRKTAVSSQARAVLKITNHVHAHGSLYYNSPQKYNPIAKRRTVS